MDSRLKTILAFIPASLLIEKALLQMEQENKEQEEKYYRIVVSNRGAQRLSIILDSCGERSLITTEENSYIVKTTKTRADKLKEDNSWVEKVELYHVHYVVSVIDE